MKYTADLPQPVRCTTSALRRCATSASMASYWPGWKAASARPVRSARIAVACVRRSPSAARAVSDAEGVMPATVS